MNNTIIIKRYYNYFIPTTMLLHKYLERMERMHLLIRRKSTGNVEELAEKLQLSRRQTLEYIHEMREMGAPIQFCTYQRTYYYAYEVAFQLAGFVELTSTEVMHTKGGVSLRHSTYCTTEIPHMGKVSGTEADTHLPINTLTYA